jgi:hypothetical protein
VEGCLRPRVFSIDASFSGSSPRFGVTGERLVS